MGNLLQRLLQIMSPDAERHQHVYATLGCCSNIRIEEHEEEMTVPSKEHDPGDLGGQQAAHFGHGQRL